jgi:hypothetical protein
MFQGMPDDNDIFCVGIKKFPWIMEHKSMLENTKRNRSAVDHNRYHPN